MLKRHDVSLAARAPQSNDIVTEDSAAMEFAELHGGKLLFDHDVDAWFVWSGTHWRKETTGLAFEWARQLCRNLAQDEKPKARYAIRKAGFAGGVERLAKVDRAFAVTSDYWDRDAFLLGTPGGTVDLRTGMMRAADPGDHITKRAAVAPAATAACPRWLCFLDETFGGDADVVAFLQRFAGYCLTGSTVEHMLFFGYGDGGNGKSVYINVHVGLLNDYAVNAPMETFATAYGDRHPTELAMLRGARLVTATETEQGRAWAESRIKQITGGDKIAARFMRQDFFEFVPEFKLAIVGNHKPTLRNVDDALRRRFAMVPFARKPAVPDRDLEAKLRIEWPGILRWMIDGCLDWQRHGLVRPKAVVAATDGYFSDQDLFGAWLDDECDIEPGNTWKSATSAELFAAWSKYASNAGDKPGSQKSFADLMQRRGIERHKGTKGSRMFRGIRLCPTLTGGGGGGA